MLFFGVDGEMSAADLSAGGRLIQIGFAAHTDRAGKETSQPPTYSSLLNPGDDYTWTEQAAAVHGFPRAEVENAMPAVEVDEQCVDWLRIHGVERERSAVAVGFNVGAFDLPHIAAVLPRTARLFTRRTVDLNAVCFTLEGRDYQGSAPSWSGWKRMATTYAERTIALQSAHGAAPHDAGFDALLHLHAWRFLRSVIHGDPLPIPQEPAGGYGKDVQQAVGALLAAHGMDGAIRRSGYTREQLKGWANGGRVSDPVVLDVVRRAISGDLR